MREYYGFWCSGCGFDRMIVLKLFSCLVFGSQSAALSSGTQYETYRNYGGMWRTECLNTRFLMLCQFLESRNSKSKDIIYSSLYIYIIILYVIWLNWIIFDILSKGESSLFDFQFSSKSSYWWSIWLSF